MNLQVFPHTLETGDCNLPGETGENQPANKSSKKRVHNTDHLNQHMNKANRQQRAINGHKHSLSGSVVIKLPVVEMLASTATFGLRSSWLKGDVPVLVFHAAIPSDIADLVFTASTNHK